MAMYKWSAKYFNALFDDLNNNQTEIDPRQWAWTPAPDTTTIAATSAAANTAAAVSIATTTTTTTTTTGTHFSWTDLANWYHHYHHNAPPPPTDPTPAPAPQPPVNSPGALTITSSSPRGDVEGATLTANVNDHDGVGTVSCRWQIFTNNAWQDIQGATGKTYVLSFTDGGHEIQALANYTDGAGHNESLQAAVAAIDVDRPGSLTVTSSGQGFVVGDQVTAHVSDPDGVGTVHYQWSLIDSGGVSHDITGAIGETYTLTTGDAGNQIDVTATYTDLQGHQDTATDPFLVTAPIIPTPPPLPPANSPGALTVTSSSPNGDVEGATLTAHVTDANGVGTVSYQWQIFTNSTWQDIQGATGQNYTLSFTDGGHEIQALASYTDGAGNHESLQTAVAAIDVDRPGTLTVTSSGQSLVVGDQVTAHLSDPDGVGPVVNYQWSLIDSNGVSHDIIGETADTYTLTTSDAGNKIDVTATYTDLQGHQDTATDPFLVTAPVTPTPPPPTTSGVLMLGVNLAGAEFGSTVPGTYGKDYTFPTHAEIDYYASKGMDVIRLPFLWERVQSSENGPLNSDYLSHMDDVVNYAATKGIKVDLDMHDYGKGFGALIGSSATPNSAYSEIWGALADHFKNDPNVIFGIMNEPNQQTATQWLTSANDAIAAIRTAGADQEILVPGTNWDGGWTWTTSQNAKVIGTGVQDPLNNYAFEVHQYLDSDGSGTHTNVVSATIGVDRLTAVTQWAEANGAKLFLGEYGVASDATSLTAMDNMLTYMQQHTDVWQGATYWAGGPWWGNYMYSIEPTGTVGHYVDKPQMVMLEEHINHPVPPTG